MPYFSWQFVPRVLSTERVVSHRRERMVLRNRLLGLRRISSDQASRERKEAIIAPSSTTILSIGKVADIM